MNRESLKVSDQGVVIESQDSTVGYGVLMVVLVALGALLVWLMPLPWRQLLQPWTSSQWSHGLALAYTIWLALVAGAIAVLGAYLSDRGRRHRLTFDCTDQAVKVREQWRGREIKLTLPAALFDAFVVHQPVDRRDQYELGATTKFGAYWRLMRSGEEGPLWDAARQLERQFIASPSPLPSPVLASTARPPRLDLEAKGQKLDARWQTWERPLTRLCIATAAGLFALASAAPLVLVFEGALGRLMLLLFAASALFGVPLFFGGGKRGVLPFVGAWLVTAVVAALWASANFIYFVLASVGLAIFGKSAVHLVQGLWDPEGHRLRIDGQGQIFEDGRLLKDHGQAIKAPELAGAIVNITAIRPPKLVLLYPGQGRENRRRHVGDLPPGAGQEGQDEFVELKTAGLSLFESLALGLEVDHHLRHRVEAGDDGSSQVDSSSSSASSSSS